MKIQLLFIILGISLSANGQKVSAILLEKQAFSKEKFIGVDKYQNLYAVQDNVFYKYEGEKEYRYNDIQLGKISSADIINPLKIVLFYRDMNTVVILDNRLNELKRINFNTLSEFRNVDFATTASDRSLWIFNIDLQQLERFNYDRNKVNAQTQPLSERVIQQESNFNYCWLLTEKNLDCYNIYGSLMKRFPAKNISHIAESNNRLLILKDNKLNILLKDETQWELLSISEIAVKDFYLNNENLYLYDGKFLYHYQLDIPK